MPHKAGHSQVTTPACQWHSGCMESARMTALSQQNLISTDSNTFYRNIDMAVNSHKDMILMYSQSHSPTALGQQELQQADRRDESAAATWQTHQTICQVDSFSLCCFACFVFFPQNMHGRDHVFRCRYAPTSLFTPSLSPFPFSIMNEELMGGSKTAFPWMTLSLSVLLSSDCSFSHM